jgi:N-hydroxyarylamine O-acetyltransferase
MRDPGSPFTNALAVLRHTTDGYVALQNDRLRSVTPNSVRELRITSADHLADTFETFFDLDVPQFGRVWEKIQAIGHNKAA